MPFIYDPKAVHAARRSGAERLATTATVATDAPGSANLSQLSRLSQGPAGGDWPFAPELDAFAERAAIAEHDGGLTRAAAERLAAEAQGFADPAALYAAAVERWRLALDALATCETSHRGREHVANARAFVAGGWAAQAAALGWSEAGLCGLCPVAPWARLDRMGAAWLRADVAAVTAERIAYACGLRLWRASRADGARVPW